jgi:hypothetical protein
MPVAIDFSTSHKLKCWFFISMIMLLFVHSYNQNERHLRPFSIVHEQLTFNSFIQYFLSNGLFRFFVPMLFPISGYLYAFHDERSYKKSSVFPLLLVLYKIVVFSGFIAAWFGSDKLVKWCMDKRWFVWLSSFSFIIYAQHAPLVAYVVNAICPLVQHIYEFR